MPGSPCTVPAPRRRGASDPGQPPGKGEKPPAELGGEHGTGRHGADPGARGGESGGLGTPARPRRSGPSGRPLEIAPLKSSEERRGWGEVANISISEEVTCDPEGGSIVPLLRGTQTLVSLSA